MTPLSLILWGILIVWGLYLTWNYFRVRRAATFLSFKEFEGKMQGAQLIDIRDTGSFQKKHILRARNLPAPGFAQSLGALRKDKPILLYDATRGTELPKVIMTLKKAGFKDVYVLKDGFDYWQGKTKIGK
ncbi:rhodanese-like domain-containing protein [Streptococcus sp. S784/96/1]|uniref:rhodanese-like domain-containing protein n=1 Tax=Streptococcus sp. S784/96/1 TaxID=2653499 RepID=UPI001389C1F0|nr:rhodanese-like domain-containing protein [Streptococcus sp. S784/96/1]